MILPAISSSNTTMEPELLHKLEGLFAFYHRQWWCHHQMFYHFKWCHASLNALALFVIAAGIIDCGFHYGK